MFPVDQAQTLFAAAIVLGKNVLRAVRDWRYEAPSVDGVRVRRRAEPVTIQIDLDRCPQVAANAGDVIRICGRTQP